MKYLLPITFIASAFLISCSTPKPLSGGEENTSTEESKEINIIEGEVTLNLYSKDKADTVESSIEYMFYENTDLPYQDSINRMVKEYVSSIATYGEESMTDNSNLSVEFMESAIDKFAAAYYEEISLYDEDDFFGGVWQTETSVGIYQENPEFVKVSLNNWDYSGGAHGNSWSEECLVDIKTGQELKLQDFFSNIDVLTAKAEAIFRADQEIPADTNLEEAGFWFDGGVFHLNENFSFNENSVDFLYNQYEIAPYVAGMIIITIPLDEVKHLLKRKVHF
jgi:hypothetical protein